jgi:hypothetical protein
MHTLLDRLRDLRSPFQFRHADFDVLDLDGFGSVVQHAVRGSHSGLRRRGRVHHDLHQDGDGRAGAPECFQVVFAWKCIRISDSNFNCPGCIGGKGGDSGTGVRCSPAAASFPGFPYVRVTGFGCGLLNFRINLTADEDSRAREI